MRNMNPYCWQLALQPAQQFHFQPALRLWHSRSLLLLHCSMYQNTHTHTCQELRQNRARLLSWYMRPHYIAKSQAPQLHLIWMDMDRFVCYRSLFVLSIMITLRKWRHTHWMTGTKYPAPFVSGETAIMTLEVRRLARRIGLNGSRICIVSAQMTNANWVNDGTAFYEATTTKAVAHNAYAWHKAEIRRRKHPKIKIFTWLVWLKCRAYAVRVHGKKMLGIVFLIPVLGPFDMH